MTTKKAPKTGNRTSDGLRDLLIRHGVKPTMQREKDIELAKKFMKRSYSE